DQARIEDRGLECVLVPRGASVLAMTSDGPHSLHRQGPLVHRVTERGVQLGAHDAVERAGRVLDYRAGAGDGGRVVTLGAVDRLPQVVHRVVEQTRVAVEVSAHGFSPTFAH